MIRPLSPEDIAELRDLLAKKDASRAQVIANLNDMPDTSKDPVCVRYTDVIIRLEELAMPLVPALLEAAEHEVKMRQFIETLHDELDDLGLSHLRATITNLLQEVSYES